MTDRSDCSENVSQSVALIGPVGSTPSISSKKERTVRISTQWLTGAFVTGVNKRLFSPLTLVKLVGYPWNSTGRFRARAADICWLYSAKSDSATKSWRRGPHEWSVDLTVS